jgi:hypothetical protein
MDLDIAGAASHHVTGTLHCPLCELGGVATL